MFKRDLELERTWASLLDNLESVIGKKPKDLNAVLFLIGVQELGEEATFQQRGKTGLDAHRHLQSS